MDIDKAIQNLTAGRKDAGMMTCSDKEYTEILDMAVKALKHIRNVHGGKIPRNENVRR